MKIIKRNGSEATFDSEKIVAAITKANNSEEGTRLSPEQIHDIADYVEYKCNKIGRAVSVEEVQDMVENQIMATGAFDLAKHYVQYRYQRSLIRKSNTTDTRILSLIECNNEEAKQENSNKNPTVNSVQRDYMAGEVSRDLTQRLLLPSDIVEADQKGLIHFHDSDYFAQHMHNCDLVNLEDMLQNGTVISETKIEKPHSFSTACNIATQIIAQVASNQYGGQSISLAHLAPFVQVSREKIRTEVAEEMKILNTQATPEQLNDIVETRLHREITKGVQTIQYQIITLMTTNGQAPFLTVFMYLNEAKNAQEKKDLALIIEETLKQRYQGVKNEAGVWITPAFPKLIYVLEDDNVEENSEYFYLTQLAAKCTARRLVPDYISEKKMKELKEGNCFPVMGCRSCLSPWKDENGNYKFYGRFNQGVVTINLPDVALSSGGDFKKFWEIFDERLDLCYRALMLRHKRLEGTLSDAAPIRCSCPSQKRRNDRQAALRRLLHDFPWLCWSVRMCQIHDRQIPHRSGSDPVRTGSHAAHERCLQQMETGNQYRVLHLRFSDREYNLQVRQMPAEAFRHHRGHNGQELYHQQLPCARYRANRRFFQAEIRVPVPGAFHRRSDQLCGGSRYAGHHPGCHSGHALYL